MNYLRTQRLKTALSQEDVAFLVGLESGANVSRHETGVRVPDLVRVIAYAALYGVPVEEIFAEEYIRAREDIRSRAGELAERVRKEPSSPFRERKLSVLAGLSADDRHNPPAR